MKQLLLHLKSCYDGALSPLFNGHTNIINSDFICFNMKDLLSGSEERSNAVLNNDFAWAWQVMMQKDGYTCICLDEMHLFLRNPYMRKLLQCILQEPLLYRVFYLTAIATGMRRGELCALRWSDVIVTGSYEGYIIVQHSRSTVSGEGVQEGKTKNGRARTVSMNEDLFSLLRGFCYRKMRLRDEHGIPFPEYIFTKDDGTPIHPDTFSKHLKALFAEIGLPKTYHLHTLRHFFVSTLLHEGVDKNTVADLAGHGDTSFLERTYCHPQMQLKQEAAKRMSNSLFAAPNPELLVS